MLLTVLAVTLGARTGAWSRSPPRRAFGLALAAILVLTLGSRRAGAQTSKARTSSLAWVRSDGAEACIGGKELAETVEHALGRPVFVSASSADVAVEGRIERDANGWRATLRVSDDHGILLGRRELESPGTDCREIDPSLAFVIAVMIDPDAATRPAPPPPGPPIPQHATSAAAPRATTWRIAPAVGATASVGQLPSVALGPTVRVRIGPPALGVEIAGTWFIPQDQSAPAGARARWTLAYAGVALCPAVVRSARVTFLACGGVAAGSIGVQPSGFHSQEQDASEVLLLADLRARVEWRVASLFFVAADLGGAVPFSRTQYVYTDATGAQQPLFRAAPIAGMADLAVGIVFE